MNLGKLMTRDEVLKMFDDTIEKLESIYQIDNGEMNMESIETETKPIKAKKKKKKKKKQTILKSFQTKESQRMVLKIIRLVHETQSLKKDFTLIPSVFKVPNEDPWPIHVRGKLIDMDAFRTAKGRNEITPKIIQKLNKINFVWDLQQHKWDRRILALKTYKKLYGNLNIDISYTIKQRENGFPRDLWEFPLGKWFAETKKNISQLSESKKRILVDAGVRWVNNPST